jgi:hypothetical protein
MDKKIRVQSRPSSLGETKIVVLAVTVCGMNILEHFVA